MLNVLTCLDTAVVHPAFYVGDCRTQFDTICPSTSVLLKSLDIRTTQERSVYPFLIYTFFYFNVFHLIQVPLYKKT